MPIYVFRCEDCGAVFEVFVFRSEDEEEIKCPKCGSEKVVKELAPFGIGGCGGMGFT
jgi:putative FmdB family regulatory protein